MRGAARDVRFGPMADSCGAAKSVLFDHLVGDGKHSRRNVEAERLGSREVDDELEFGWRLHWHIAGLLTLEDAIDVAGGAPELVDQISDRRR
jgi:hypothetical protein